MGDCSNIHRSFVAIDVSAMMPRPKPVVRADLILQKPVQQQVPLCWEECGGFVSLKFNFL